MATKQRQRRRPQPGRRSFQRRLTWQEVEGAFDHLFRHGLDDDAAERITFRFRRARTQVMPVLSWLVVSPYEIERNLGLGIVQRVGGQAALRMLDDLIADSDVYDPFKRELRLLRETVDGGGKQLSRYEEALDDEDDEEAADDDGATEVTAAEPRADEPPDERRRRERRPKPKPRREPATPVSADLFDDSDRFLAALDGPVEPLLEAFRQIGEAKRLSFIDRAGKLDDDRVVAFLLPLLETDEWALVQSALNALGNLGRAAAVPAVEKLAESTARKRVKQRAERVLERLRAAQPEPGGDEPAEKPKRRRRRRRRGGAEAEAAEPEAAEPEPAEEPEPEPLPEPEPPESPRPRAGGELGLRVLALEPVPIERLPSLAAPAEVPRLRRCLAGPIRVDGRQRLIVERGEAGGPGCRLSLEVDDQSGLRSVRFEADRPADSTDAGDAIEVTAGYVRARLEETVGESLAGYDLAPLHAFIGPRRRAETALDLPTEAAPPEREAVEALLDHPLFDGWRIQLDLDGAGLQRWVATRGRRSASRIRRRLIDDAVAEWLPAVGPARLVDRLRRQAWLLKRGRHEAMAEHLLALAAAIDAQGAGAAHSELVREMAYRGFTAGGDAVYTRRRRRRDYAWLAGRRATLARSAAQRARRR